MKRYLLLLSVFAALLTPAAPVHASAPAIPKILCVGDSITEGGTTFSNWRLALWEKLYTAGYLVEYIGPRASKSRIGDLAHHGYGGKNAEFLAAEIGKYVGRHPADIVLIHAGHNHDAAEGPIPGILAATEKIIAECRAANPRTTFLLAQVITSGKLPKYSYIPALNSELAQLAQRLGTPASQVVLVDQASGFDPAADTVADKVHPNARGAEKMAARWFAALRTVLPKPAVSYAPRIVPYKTTPAGELTLHIFEPAKQTRTAPRPAIVFFFGGGWTQGTPLQFYPECAHFASNGYVAVSADYRISSLHKSTPFDSVTDGKSAIRWLRGHAKELDIDPGRIVAAGASAGGQIAAAAGTLAAFDDPAEDGAVSARPNALVLFYPVLDNGPDGYGHERVKDRWQEFSPLHNVTAKTPPTLVFAGSADKLVPTRTIEAFRQRMAEAGVLCEVKVFEGGGHPLFEYKKGDSPVRRQILDAVDRFLVSKGIK